MGRLSARRVRFRDQSLTPWRAMEKGVEPTQTGGKSFRRIHLCDKMNQNRCRQVEAKTTKEREGRTSMKEELARTIRIHTRILGLRWEVDLVEGTIPMRHWNAVEKPTVREQLVTLAIATDCFLRRHRRFCCP